MQKRKKIVIIALMLFLVTIIIFVGSNIFFDSSQVFGENETINGSISALLTDEETGKPIGKFSDESIKVTLNGIEQGTLTREGQILIENVDPGLHDLVLEIPQNGEITEIVMVDSGKTLDVEMVFDMPNPLFDLDLICEVTNQTVNAAMTCTSTVNISKKHADLTITLTNVGDAISQSTKVFLFVHNEKNISSPMIVQSIDFPVMEPRSQGGESITRNISFDSFITDSKEIVSVVIIDNGEYRLSDYHHFHFRFCYHEISN